MSLRTRTRGYTAWVNMRLRPYECLLNNVMMDLLTGTNMKNLTQSLCGRIPQRLDTFDGLSDTQKVTRMDWIVDELKATKVIPGDVHVDTRMFAMRSADHVFELLWRIVCHDIWFVWERLEYLQHDRDDTLTEVPFTWVPQPPPVKKKVKQKQSLLSGFGASSLVSDKIDEDQVSSADEGFEPFPKADYMRHFKGKKVKAGHYPPPDECVIEMINTQLMTTQGGEKLLIKRLDDMADSRVICTLINSFIPNTFATEVLLNDRWTINLALRTAEDVLYLSSPFDSEDLAEADPKTICTYFCSFFMAAFKYRQLKAVVRWNEHLKNQSNVLKQSLAKLSSVLSNMKDVNQRKQIKMDLDNIKTLTDRLVKKYDLEFGYKWMEHVSESIKLMQRGVRKKIKEKFDSLEVPRLISISDLILALMINLNFTNGSGFYLATEKEALTVHRKVVLRDKLTGAYYENYSGKKADAHVKKLLKISKWEEAEILPEKFTRYDIYLEALSRNRVLKEGSVFLYQVFPFGFGTWTRILFKAIRDKEVDTVTRMTTFFHNEHSFINAKEASGQDSPLHVACRTGNYEICLVLLEAGADVDQKNYYRQTPMHLAVDGNFKDIGILLLEWGANIHIKGPRGLTPFENIHNDDTRLLLISRYHFYSRIVPQIMEGDVEMLAQVIEDHATGKTRLSSLRSRVLNGSTLLHTAAYFGLISVLQELLALGVDVNLFDYKGATALHRARNVQTMQYLVDQGIKVNVEDNEGNTPLHVKSYGESNTSSQLDVVESLLKSQAKVDVRNHRALLPIHCAAMQGRADIVQVLIHYDKDERIRKALAEEDTRAPPSLPHLALANGFVDCANWLLNCNFLFKEGETDLLLQRILSEQLKLANRQEAVDFLLQNEAEPNPRYPGGNSALHYACTMSGDTDALETLLDHDADVDAMNEDGATALFFACQCNNLAAAQVLLTRGASVRIKNLQGLTAFDFIIDYEEWVDYDFSPDIKARLKAYNLKHARDLIRAISKRVKGPSAMYRTLTPKEEKLRSLSLPAIRGGTFA